MANTPPQNVLFQGRPDDPRLGQLVVLESVIGKKSPSEKNCFVLFGTPEERGVVANRGRAGTASGPDSIRRHLYKMTPPMTSKPWSIVDLGNTDIGVSLDACHREAQKLAKAAAHRGDTVFALGGGNDVSTSHALGWIEAHPGISVGMINIDPHLDVRPPDPEPHSGTPYRRLLDGGAIEGKNLIEFGTHPQRTAAAHRKYCEDNGVEIVWFEEPMHTLSLFKNKLDELSTRVEAIGVSVDIDCCSEAEGSSAAGVLGFSTRELVGMARDAGKNPRVRWFEIVEAAPSLDPTERSSRVASELLHAFLRGRLGL